MGYLFFSICSVDFLILLEANHLFVVNEQVYDQLQLKWCQSPIACLGEYYQHLSLHARLLRLQVGCRGCLRMHCQWACPTVLKNLNLAV